MPAAARRGPRGESAAATSTRRTGSSSTTGRPRSSRRARTSRRASTRPRRRACAGSPSRAALRVPAVLGVADDVLVLDWVDEGRARRRGRARRGPGRGPRGGRAPPSACAAGAGRCASAPLSLPNDPAARLADVLRERPPAPRSSARLPTSTARARSSACARGCAELAGPPEPPARLHGDLWSGNVLWGRDGRPWLIDPAAYGGHREVDLAMLQLFGSPGRAFLAAYEERQPARRPATRSASRSSSCSRCSSTPRCSAAATRPRRSGPPSGTL